MNFRKVLAALLSVAMVASLIVVPVSSATAGDIASFDDIIPTKGEVGSTIFTESATQAEVSVGSADGATTILGGGSIPSNGAVYFNFASITGTDSTTNNYASVDVPVDNGGNIRMQIGVDSNAIRFRDRNTLWTTAYVTTEQVTLASGFEIIVKDIGSAFEIWVKAAGASDFTFITSYNQQSTEAKKATNITTKGTAVANLTSAAIYETKIADESDAPEEEPEESYTGTHTFAEVLNTEAPAEGETAYVFTESASVTNYNANVTGDTNVANFTTISVGGAAHYKFSGISGTMWGGDGDGYLAIHGLWEDAGKGYALYLGHSSAPIRFNFGSGTNYNQWQTYTPEYLDITKPFDFIIKDNSAENESTPVQLWLSVDNGETFTLLGEHGRSVIKSPTNQVSSTTGSASTTISATVYTGESKTGASAFTGTHTLAQVLNTAAPAVGETAYVYTAGTPVENYTITGSGSSNTTDTGETAASITNIPEGGAVRWQVDLSLGSAANNYMNFLCNWGGVSSQTANILLGYVGSEGPVRIQRQSSTSHDWYSDAVIDFSQPFEFIMKDVGNKTVEYWYSGDGGETYALLVSQGYAGGTRTPSVAITPGSSATVTATVYTGESKTGKAYVSEDSILPKTGEEAGDIYYSQVNASGALEVTSAEVTTMFTSGVTSIPSGGAVHYKFNGVTNTDGTNQNFAQITLDIGVGADKGSSDLQIGGGTQAEAIHAYVGGSWSDAAGQIAASNELDLTKPFELIIKHDGSTLTYYVKGTGDTGFWLAGEELTTGAHNSRNPQITAKGNTVVSLANAILYEADEVEAEAPVIEGTHTFDQIIDSAAPGADTLKYVYTAGASISNYTTKSASDVNDNDVIASGTLTQDKSVAPVTLIPGGGAAYYKIDGITLEGSGNQYIMIDFKWDVEQNLGGSFRIGRVNDADDFSIRGSATSLAKETFNQHYDDAQIDITKPFELIVKDLSNSDGEVQYWVKQSNAEKFRLLATYKYAQNRTPSFNTTSGASAVFASAAVYSRDAKFGGSADLVELRNEDLTSDPTGGALTGNWIYAIVNPSVAAGSALIFAGYKADDSLVNVKVVDITGGSEYQIEELRLGDWTDAVDVKVFLWDGINTMTPVAGYDVKAFTK